MGGWVGACVRACVRACAYLLAFLLAISRMDETQVLTSTRPLSWKLVGVFNVGKGLGMGLLWVALIFCCIRLPCLDVFSTNCYQHLATS